MKKLYSTLVILGLIHLMPVLQGCPSCNNVEELFVNATDVVLSIYGVDHENHQGEMPHYVAQTLQFYIQLTYPDSLLWASEQTFSTLSPALAKDQCEDFYVTIVETINDLQIESLKGDGTLESITEQFYAPKDGLLYQSISDYLHTGPMQTVHVFSSWDPVLDSATLVLTTTLSDERVFQDTVKLFFQ